MAASVIYEPFFKYLHLPSYDSTGGQSRGFLGVVPDHYTSDSSVGRRPRRLVLGRLDCSQLGNPIVPPKNVVSFLARVLNRVNNSPYGRYHKGHIAATSFKSVSTLTDTLKKDLVSFSQLLDGAVELDFNQEWGMNTGDSSTSSSRPSVMLYGRRKIQAVNDEGIHALPLIVSEMSAANDKAAQLFHETKTLPQNDRGIPELFHPKTVTT